MDVHKSGGLVGAWCQWRAQVREYATPTILVPVASLLAKRAETYIFIAEHVDDAYKYRDIAELSGEC